MRIELGESRPDYIQPTWPGQFDLFSYFEFACGIPSVLYAISTVKENGLYNISLNAWSTFTGGADGFYAVIAGMSRTSHSYINIHRTGEFVINFLGPDYYKGCMQTIKHNAYDTDEFKAGGFTPETARTVACPRINEAFLCLECTLENEMPIAKTGDALLLAGRVRHIAAREAFAEGMDDKKYGPEGFMLMLNEPMNLKTGVCTSGGAAALSVVRRGWEG